MRQKENRKCERCCKPPCDCLLFGCFFCRNKSVLCKQSYVNWATVPAQSTILCLYRSAHSRQVGTTWIPFWIKAVYDSMILIYDSRRWGSHFQVVALLNCYVLLWEVSLLWKVSQNQRKQRQVLKCCPLLLQSTVIQQLKNWPKSNMYCVMSGWNLLFLIYFVRITFSGITSWLACVDGDLFSATLHLRAVLQEAGVGCMRPEHFHTSSGTHGRAELSVQPGKPGINPAIHFHMPFAAQLIWDMRQWCFVNKTWSSFTAPQWAHVVFRTINRTILVCTSLENQYLHACSVLKNKYHTAVFFFLHPSLISSNS